MVITGMNRFFAKHGRIAFFLIAVVISVAFVMFMTGQSIFDLFMQRSRGPAKLVVLNREVDQNKRMEAVDQLLIQQALRFPSISLQNPDYQKLDSMGINNLMLLYAAQDRGIAIGDDEVKKYLQSVPQFQTKGKFDVKKFNVFVDEKLKPRHFDKEDLDSAVRSQLAVEKLTQDFSESIIVPDEEIKEAFFNINEKAKVQTAEFKADSYAKEVKVDEQEAKSYFEANKNKYMTPSAVKFELVRFEYGKFRTEAYKQVTDKEVKEYYEKNKYLYIKKDKKPKDEDKKEKDKDKKEVKKKVEYTPLKDVAAKIKNKLAETKSRKLAAKAATDFSDNVYDKTKDLFYDIKDTAAAQKKCQEIFNNYAKSNNKKVFTPDWIYEGTNLVPKIGDEPELTKAVTGLFIDNPVSEAIKGKKAAFVAILTAKRGQQPETFENKKAEVISDLKESKALNLARESAREKAVQIGEQLDKGQAFAKVIKDLKVPFKPLPMELKAAAPAYIPNGNIIQDAAFKTAQGQIAGVQNTADGAILIYVEKKTYPNEEEYEKQKAMFSMRYKMMKQQTVWRSYTQLLVAASAPEKKEQ